ncbi:transport protein particle component-domain-containing protein [Lipomyces japonicus]|uniref:transport protein particle component-domain-containing protein n=1 Tax=Lipomyces japonicus TaxID=56871 RepID=UPI0034CE4555
MAFISHASSLPRPVTGAITEAESNSAESVSSTSHRSQSNPVTAGTLPTVFTDPHAMYLNLACLDFLLIELLPLSNSVVSVLEDESEQNKNNANDGGAHEPNHVSDGVRISNKRAAVQVHIDSLGYRVGLAVVERFSQDRPRFTDVLDVMKFICKDLWSLVFRKQIDNLKTNHRGVFVLTDSSFRLLMRMSTEPGGNVTARATPYLWFPAGLVRGALAGLGVQATVVAETNGIPVATFHVETVRQE